MIAGVELDLDRCFSPDYATARARFLAAPADERRSYLNPNSGPSGEQLATDVAWVGPRDSDRVLVLVSSTHGVEGFCGSGAQLDFLSMRARFPLPSGTAVLIVHAINPYGFAWLRRVTEENVDLNRNCIDFSEPLPPDIGYAELADDFVPPSLAPNVLDAAQTRIEARRAELGNQAFEDLRSGGQHVDPKGIFYRGLEPTWSRRTLEAICDDWDLASRSGVAVIDFHTGLGRYGYGEPICGHRPDEPGRARCVEWYGPSLGEPLLGNSSSLPIAGLTQYAWLRKVGTARLTFIALEFGTVDFETIAKALQTDQWLYAHGAVDWASEETRRIRGDVRRCYYPDREDWKELVLVRSRQVIGQALLGLSRSPAVSALPDE